MNPMVASLADQFPEAGVFPRDEADLGDGHVHRVLGRLPHPRL
jgi:hypothetical protein